MSPAVSYSMENPLKAIHAHVKKLACALIDRRWNTLKNHFSIYHATKIQGGKWSQQT